VAAESVLGEGTTIRLFLPEETPAVTVEMAAHGD
jgi:hypothetical protein